MGGDLLIIAGDLTASDKVSEYVSFALWLDRQKYKQKIIVNGNHDKLMFFDAGILDSIPDTKILNPCNPGTKFQGLKIYGSPWCLKIHGMNTKCDAFTCHSEGLLLNHWYEISKFADIVVTHSPPFGILDGVPIEDGSLFHCGSPSLYEHITSMVRPRLHVFGHIHEGYGTMNFDYVGNEDFERKGTTTFVNASHVNGKYQPVNRPIRIIL